MYIFDLDGTLADINHRRHLVEKGNTRWDEFYAACVDDTPVRPVINLLKGLYGLGENIAILSGRSDVVKKETEEWLRSNTIPYDHLIMRPENNYTPDQDLKKQMLKTLEKDYLEFMQKTFPHAKFEFEVDMIFDDRDKVVKMWREEGYVCCQVAKGNF